MIHHSLTGCHALAQILTQMYPQLLAIVDRALELGMKQEAASGDVMFMSLFEPHFKQLTS